MNVYSARKTCIAVFVLIASSALVEFASAQPLLSLRFASLNAVLKDAATVAEAAGQPFDATALLNRSLAMAGISDPSVVDAKRPMMAVLPVEGMLLQQRGVVVAVPVTSTVAALDALAASMSGRKSEGALHVFTDPSGNLLYVAAKGDYLVVGQTRDFVGRFDAAVLSRPWDGPSGAVQLEVFLEPLLPLLQAGLVSAREQLKNEIQEQWMEPPSTPSEKPAPAHNAVAEMVDLYVDTAQGLLMDLSRVQATADVSSDHVFYRQRVVPKPGSATAEFVAAQKGDLPALARSVQVGTFSVAGHVTVTPRLEAGLKTLTSRYVGLMRRLLEEMEQAPSEGGPEREELKLFAAYLAQAESLLADGLRCFTGDLAASMDFTAQGGMGISQAFGYGDTETCRSIASRSVQQVAALTPGEGGEEKDRVENVEVAGFPAQRFTADMSEVLRDAGPEERRLLERWYGGTRVENYVALAGGAMYSALGSSARERLASMLRAQGEGRAASEPIKAATFAPLVPGPGLYLGMDLSKALAFARDVTEEDDRERARLEYLAEHLTGAAGRAAMGLGFDSTGATFHLAVPLKALGAAREAPLPPSTEKGQGT